MMFRALLLVSLVSPVWAQLGNTIYQQVATGLTAPAIVPAGGVNNIGQYYHQFTVYLRNAPSKVCAVASPITAAPLFANDQAGANFFYPSYVGTATGGAGLGPTYSASKEYRFIGAYPYIKFQVLSFDTVNCVADVVYTGTISGQGLLGLYGATYKFFNTSTGGDNVVLTGANTNINIKSLQLYNVTAGQTVILKDSTGVVIFKWTSLPAGASIVWSYVDLGQAGTTFGSNLVLNLSAATEVSIGFTYSQT